MTGLKPSPDIVQDTLYRYRYKYTSADNRYYILAFYVIGLDGISRAYWSRYSYSDSNHHEEGNTTLSKDFREMIEAEEWIDEGYEAVISQ